MQLPSRHRVRRDHLVRWTLAALVLAAAGLGLGALALMGELVWWSALLAATLLGFAGLTGRDLPGDFSREVTLDARGVRWAERGRQLHMPWTAVRKAHLTKKSGEVRAITLTDDSGQLTLGEELERWNELCAHLCERFGVG